MSIYDKASLVLIPSGTKTSKVYSQVPTNGDGDFTFSRSTAATRVNASGNIEKETQNLFTYSNTFSDSSWYKVNTSVTGGQSGYDGTNDAWLLSKSAASAQVYKDVGSNVSTYSIYAKAGTLGGIRLVISTTSTYDSADFDLTNGVLGAVGSVIDASIEDVGGGWYRCSIVGGQVPITRLRMYPATSAGSIADASGNIYIQDAQLEQGLVARDYIETTTTAIYGGITDNVPRLDYTDSLCPALLLEPQRTNLLEDSEYFGSSYWGSARVSVFTNNAVSPEGFQNASYIEQQSGNTSAGGIFNGTIFTASAHTQSIFAKKKEKGFIALAENASAGNLRYSWFDIENGNIGTINGGHTAKIEDYGNGWYRCSITYTAINTGSGYSAFYYLSDTDSSISVDGSGGLYVYGATLEAGSYATSYIPTYGSAVTRNADSYYNNNMASLYDSANGFCLYFEYADVKRGDTAFFDYFSFQQLPNTDTGFRAEAAGTNNLEWRIYTDNIDSDLGFPMRVSNIESKRKVLMKVETTGIKLFADGSLEDSQSGYVVIPTLGTLQPLRSTAQPSVTQIKQSLGQILYLPVLSDEECIDLTTL